jgi:hypothetical protein
MLLNELEGSAPTPLKRELLLHAVYSSAAGNLIYACTEDVADELLTRSWGIKEGWRGAQSDGWWVLRK